MSTMQFLVFTTVCGAVLALWLDRRFAARAPATLRGVLICLVVAVVGLNVSPFLTGYVVGMDSARGAVLAVLFVVLPILTYFFLAAIWAIKAAQRLLGMRY